MSKNLKPNPYVIKFFLLLLLLVLLSVFTCGCKKEQQKEKALPVVTSEEVDSTQEEYTIKTSGTLEPIKESKLSFKVSGTIQQDPLEKGRIVETGDTIAQIDDSEYSLQVESARYLLNLATIDLEKNKTDLARYEELYKEGYISKQEIDNARFANKVAKAKAGQAATSLKQADLLLSYTNLTAPYSGVILDKFIEQGEIVSPDVPVVSLGQINPLKLNITVSSSQLNDWNKNEDAYIYEEALSSNKRVAKVHNISPSASGFTGSFEVELVVDNSQKDLKPGQVVTVEQKVKSKSGLWIPLKSVISRGENLKYIYIINPDNTVKQRIVKLGPVVGDKVIITEGLNAGEKIVVMMPENLRAGDKVEVKIGETN